MNTKCEKIGIREEQKSIWERRAPLAPVDVAELVSRGLSFCVQPSKKRVFSLDEYEKAGAEISPDLSSCPIVLGVKEIPVELMREGVTYLYFSHTIKGQSYNMPALRRLMELGCNLIDYEKIEDEKGRRLIFFGRHAGLAGMIDALWALGKRLKEEDGLDTPFAALSPAHAYAGLERAKKSIRETGDKIAADGLPPELSPFVCGFAGYGNVSAGAQEIYDLLPVEEISPYALINGELKRDPHKLYKVVFKEEHMVVHRDPEGKFDLQEYYDEPQRYKGVFEQYLPHMTMLMNCVYWEEKYPRLVTIEALKKLQKKEVNRFRLIGDISCDVKGGVEATVKATQPDDPVFVYDPVSETESMGFAGTGVAVLAVDNLPCELPREATLHFSEALKPFLENLASTDKDKPFEALNLLPELKRALILHRGTLTPDFQYLQESL